MLQHLNTLWHPHAQHAHPSWNAALYDGHIVVEFLGHVDADAGATSAEWALSPLRQQELHLVFIAAGMTGYDTAARKAWQQLLFPFRHNLLSVHLASDSAVMKLGVTMFGIALDVDTHMHATSESLLRSLGHDA